MRMPAEFFAVSVFNPTETADTIRPYITLAELAKARFNFFAPGFQIPILCLFIGAER